MNIDNFIKALLKSSQKSSKTLSTNEEINSWIDRLNSNTYVNIKETNEINGTSWYYDNKQGSIVNKNGKFFSITGLQYYIENELIKEQPIIIQDEIGFLGVIAKEINGVLYFLVQGKIEPGNINGIQISPTIQATKSNFTRAHGGQVPKYLEWFMKTEKNVEIIYDQVQSEQGTRFLGKRNRNIIILINDDIEVYPNFKWLTLNQIQELLKLDNIVNMDLRTVLSGLFTSFDMMGAVVDEFYFTDKSLYNSIKKDSASHQAIAMLNDYKMFNEVTKKKIPLTELSNWNFNNLKLVSKTQADFEVNYYNVEIAGREVKSWQQPLFKATNEALFSLFTCVDCNVRKFLIKLSPEIGCFDKVEFGPTIQIANYKEYNNDKDLAYSIFKKQVEQNKNILQDVMLSEEGGRFYHETNRNTIIEIDKNEFNDLGNEYIWVTYGTLNKLIKMNNVLNIQLRNLLTLIKL